MPDLDQSIMSQPSRSVAAAREHRLAAATVAAIVWTSALLIASLTLHAVAHVRMHHYPGHILVTGGVIGYVAAVAMLVLALRQSPSSPIIAMAVGFGTAIPVAIVHLVPLPGWLSMFSYSFVTMRPEGFAWFTLVASILSGLLLGLAGLQSRSRGGATAATPPGIAC